jgi:hypothetical protein
MNIAYPGNRLLKLAIAVSVMAALLAASPAFGQGFMVKPMKMEFTARPGQTVETVLELRNAGADEAKTLELKLVELAQNSDGSWQIIESGTDVDTSKLSSCLKWVKLSADTVTVEPMKMAPVTVSVRPPPNARGFYLAGLIAQIKTKPAEKGITVVVRFMIPILLEIEGRPERQQIQLSDVGMAFRKGGENLPAATLVSMGIANEGRTYSRIKGSVKVMYFSSGRWRPVSTADIQEKGIIPGAKLALPAELNRRLPSGKYKLTATLYVDGRRVKPLEKEIDFEGDPAVTKLAVDTALALDPPELTIAGAPGGMRTAVIKVENASEDEVNIEAASLVPPSLRGVAMGELKGDDLSCAEWLEVSPAKFTLRAGGKQNIRVIAKMPKAEVMQANYYGLVTLRATYADGQGAGETKTLVCVANKGVESKPAAQAAKMTLAAAEGAKYAVQARFANIGNVHFKPKCRAVIVTGQGQTVTEIELAGEEGLMLPLETRDFSGEIDFDKVEPGTYALKVVMDCGSGQGAADQMPLRVAVEDGQKTVTIIAREAAGSTAPAGEAVPGAGVGGGK